MAATASAAATVDRMKARVIGERKDLMGSFLTARRQEKAGRVVLVVDRRES